MSDSDIIGTDAPIDFSDVKGLEPIKPQRVAFEIMQATSGIAQSSGQPKVDVRLKVVAPGEIENRVIFDTFSFHPNALPFTKEKLVALGMGDFNGSADDLAEALLGQDGVANVGIQEGTENPATGEMYPDRNRITRYHPPGTPLETGSVASLD